MKKSKSLFFDARSIGLFRIILGLGLIFQHIFIKWPGWDLFFSANGCLNQSNHLNYLGELRPSIFIYIQHEFFFHTTMAVALLSYLCVLLGVKTKYTSFIAIFFYWNVNQHLVFLNSGWDMYGMCMLTIALLLPLDQAFSLLPSSYSRRLLPKNQKWIFYFCILQISFIYVTSSLTKTDVTWLNGTAFKNIIDDHHIQRWLAKVFLQSPLLLKGMNYMTLVLELLIGTLVLLYSVLPKKMRIIPSVLLFILHVGIFLVLDVEPFIFFALSAGALLLPKYVWASYKEAEKKVQSTKSNSRFQLIPSYIAVTFILVCSIANLNSLSNRSYVKSLLQKTKVKKITSKLMSLKFEDASFINQTWDFYSFTIPGMSCLKIEAQLKDGQSIDILRIQDISPCERRNYFEKKYLSLLRIYALNSQSDQVIETYARCQLNLQLNQKEYEKISYQIIDKN